MILAPDDLEGVAHSIYQGLGNLNHNQYHIVELDGCVAIESDVNLDPLFGQLPLPVRMTRTRYVPFIYEVCTPQSRTLAEYLYAYDQQRWYSRPLKKCSHCRSPLGSRVSSWESRE